jgi:uncharacterized membrane protein YfcA
VSAKTDRSRRAAAWSAVVLIAIGGIIGAIVGSWLVVALAVVSLVTNAGLLMARRPTRPDR